MTRSGTATRPAPHHLRRRRLALLGAVVALLAGLVAGLRTLVYDSGLADVEGVEVSGTVALAVPDVVAAAAVVPGTPLAAVDAGAVASRVGALPPVAGARVSRDWPHTVSIAITERVAVAMGGTPRGLALVDATGTPFLPAPQPPPPLPRLTVAAVRPGDEQTAAALAVLTALPPPLRDQVETVGAGGEGRFVTLALTGGRTVRWGSPDRSDRKAAVLGPLLTRKGSVYDVASPELPTVRR